MTSNDDTLPMRLHGCERRTLTDHRRLHVRAMRRMWPVVALSLASCGDGTGPATESVRGVVSLSTVWGNPLPSGGVTVGVEGTGLTTETLPDGTWELNGVPSGEYSLTFDKGGFGPMRFVGRSGRELPDTTYMGQTPTFGAIIDSSYVSTEYGDSALIIRGHVTERPPDDAVARVIIVYEGTSPNVSPDPAHHSFTAVSISQALMTNQGERIPPLQEFISLFFLQELRVRHSRGTVLHFVVYPYSAACSCYDDATGRRVYTNHGARGTAISFVLP